MPYIVEVTSDARNLAHELSQFRGPTSSSRWFQVGTVVVGMGTAAFYAIELSVRISLSAYRW